MSWDINLCMQSRDKVLVPFHYFVKSGPQLTSVSSSCSFPFFSLPIDLQLIIYEHCDAPTLFQLMQTCSHTRCVATKLFWEGTFTKHWYHCPDYWLFEHRDRRYTFTRHCSKFASQVTNVEIDLIRLELRFEDGREDHDERTRATTISKAKRFWSKVEKIFPAVRRVVLTGCEPWQSPPLPSGRQTEDYDTIETVVSCAPSHIEVYIAFVAFPNTEPHRPPRNTLWQAADRWRVLDADWKPTRVLLPSHKWTVSPLGDIETFIRRYHTVVLETHGIEWLMIESYARYAVQDVIHCPRLDCTVTYKQRDLWKQHLSQSGHGRFDIRRQSDKDIMLQLFCYKHTPEAETLAIEARQRCVDAQTSQAARIQRRVRHGWGCPGSEQRWKFEEELRAQLETESVFIPEEPGQDEMSAVDQYLEHLYEWL